MNVWISVPRCDEHAFIDWESQVDSAVNQLPPTPQQPGQPQLTIIACNLLVWEMEAPRSLWSECGHLNWLKFGNHWVQPASPTQEHLHMNQTHPTYIHSLCWIWTVYGSFMSHHYAGCDILHAITYVHSVRKDLMFENQIEHLSMCHCMFCEVKRVCYIARWSGSGWLQDEQWQNNTRVCWSCFQPETSKNASGGSKRVTRLSNRQVSIYWSTHNIQYTYATLVINT